MEFSVRYEFSISRRVPWDDDHETLHAHLKQVQAQIASHDAVENVAIETDVEKADLALDFSIFGSNRETIESEAVGLVATAIRDAGAYHQGMMPHEVEIKFRPNLGAFSGLRTPTWRVKRSSMTFRRSGDTLTGISQQRSAIAG